MKQIDLFDLHRKVGNIYDYGCYFIDLLFIGLKREPDMNEILSYYDHFVFNDWMDEDCFVNNPAAILKALTGKDYDIKKSYAFDINASFIIGYYYNKDTNLHHFVVMNKDNEVLWDSLGKSNTVANGNIESYRLFYEREC